MHRTMTPMRSIVIGAKNMVVNVNTATSARSTKKIADVNIKKEWTVKEMINANGTHKVKVLEHIILRNLWEYYVLDDENNTNDVKFCYVLGFENEFGDVPMEEIKPYIITRTKDLEDVMPAPGYRWLS